jgi:hypothetical protein
VPHCFDSSSYIECWTRFYPPDVFPGLWDRLDGLADADGLFSPREVLVELEMKEDGLPDWVRQRPKILVELDEEVQEAVRAILAAYPLLVKATAQRTEADAFVIAVAEVRGLTVVSQEKPGSAARPQIPDVCAARGVPCIDVLQFIRDQGWTFA